MSLMGERLGRLQSSLRVALNQEWPRINNTRRKLARLQPTIIHHDKQVSGMPVIATVATDGGESRLQLEPIRMQVVRVADSTGVIYFEDFIPLSLSPEEMLRFYFKSEPRLQKFLDHLNCGWDQLLPNTDFQRSNLLAMLRELMEWAALLELATQPPAKLLLRDGLLRSVLLTSVVFRALQAKFRELAVQHGHLLAGVAKRSRVINYLSVALNLNESFRGGQPAFMCVPAELEREAAPNQYRWIGDRAMGQLFMARLDQGEAVPLLPVDVAAWQAVRAPEVMSLLQASARASFPIRGYPQALRQAHEHAHLGRWETELLERLLLEQLAAHDPAVAQQARLLQIAGRRLVEELNHDQNDES
jgi:hypothetical protein